MSIESYKPDMVPLSSDEQDFDARLSELPDQYELIGKVYEGGMGSIYEARNRYTGAHAAIKVLRAESARNREAVQRFIFEAKASGSLKHHNICQVYDFGITKSGMPYLIMDWIDGISLQVKVREQGRMFFRDAIPVFQQVAAALAYAHKNSVIHRDIKPENIMLGPDDMGNLQVRMVDFGIAKGIGDAENSPETQGFTKTGMVVGTPLYMSPEQVTAGPVDVRTDIYSLGCVMYFTLTGNPPFTGESTVEIFTKHMNSEVPVIDRALKIPQDLKRIILKSMEKNPADRYQSMELLALDLKKVTKGVAIKRHFLASERRTLLHTSLIIMCFILGFVAFYNLSLWIQSTGHQPNIGEASRKDILPTKPQAN